MERSAYRTELSWTGPVGSAGKLTSALKGWQRIRFEVTEEATRTSEAERYGYTPALGVFHALTGIHSDILIPEDWIKQAVMTDAFGASRSTKPSPTCSAARGTRSSSRSARPATVPPARWLHEVV